MFILPMEADIENAVQAGKLSEQAAAALRQLPPGTYCFHKSWGFGRITEVNLLLNQVLIDFKTRKGHSMQPQYAAESLAPLAESHILVQKAVRPDEIKALAKDDAVELVRIILRSYGGKATQDQIAQSLEGEIFNAAEFKRWWDTTKKALKKDGLIAFPSKKTEPLVLREKAISQGEELLEAFFNARQIKAQIAALDQIIRNVSEVPKEQAARVVAIVEDAAQKNRRLNTAQTIELVLGRDELCQLAGVEGGCSAIALSGILLEEERRLHEILAEIPAAKQRRVLAGFPVTWEAPLWNTKLLDLISRSPVRSVGEGAKLMDEQGLSGEFRKALDRWIGDHTISVEVLTWLCREREGTYADVVDARVLSAVLSALERDQFNDIRKGGRLHDTLLDDRELIPDMLATADAETVRDIIRKIMLSSVFEELDKRSVLGRIVRVFPEMEAMLTHSENAAEKQEALIVSWESLERRKTEYEDLITKKIPENTKEISVARSYGDLRENFEFKAAKEMQRVLMRRKSEAERELAQARGTDFANPDTTQVSIGTIVTLREVATGKEQTYTLLGAWDSDPANGIISYKAAIAQAILGHKAGEQLEVPTEHGSRMIEILSIRPYKA